MMWDAIRICEKSQTDISPWTPVHPQTDADLLEISPHGMPRPILLPLLSAIWCCTCSPDQSPKRSSKAAFPFLQTLPCCSWNCFGPEVLHADPPTQQLPGYFRCGTSSLVVHSTAIDTESLGGDCKINEYIWGNSITSSMLWIYLCIDHILWKIHLFLNWAS